MDETKIRTPQAELLMQAMLSLKDTDEAFCFFEDLCTIAEIRSMSQRFEVAILLRQKVTYQEIARMTGASTATISRVNRCLNYGLNGYTRVLDTLQEKGYLKETK